MSAARIGLAPAARIIDVVGGASTLVDDLLARGFSELTVRFVPNLSGASLGDCPAV